MCLPELEMAAMMTVLLPILYDGYVWQEMHGFLFHARVSKPAEKKFAARGVPALFASGKSWRGMTRDRHCSLHFGRKRLTSLHFCRGLVFVKFQDIWSQEVAEYRTVCGVFGVIALCLRCL